MKHFEWMACIFVGIPCIAVLLYILPLKNIIWEIFVLSCVVMSIVSATARLVKGILRLFSEKTRGMLNYGKYGRPLCATRYDEHDESSKE